MKVTGGGPPSGHKVTPVVHPLYCLVNAGSRSEGGEGEEGGVFKGTTVKLHYAICILYKHTPYLFQNHMSLFRIIVMSGIGQLGATNSHEQKRVHW